MNSQCVLITGGAGFIGNYVLRQFLAHDYGVSVLDNFSTGSREKLATFGDAIEVTEGDAADFALVREMTKGVDCVVHLAAVPSVMVSKEKPWVNQRSGEVAGLAVLHAAALNKVRRVVLASSAAVYGNPGRCPIPETAPLAPISNYGVSKAALEMYGRSYSQNYPGTDVVSLRFFNVYGPGQNSDSAYSGVISIFCRRARENQSPTIYGTGEQTRDFVYVEDVARACLLAARSDASFNGASFNIATGKPASLTALWATIAAATSSTAESVFGPARPSEILHSHADVSTARDHLGFACQIDLQQGLQRLITQ